MEALLQTLHSNLVIITQLYRLDAKLVYSLPADFSPQVCVCVICEKWLNFG